jgi:antibiotic biosynthesis monooxygenase (ABM) superfamily enzyme
MYYVVIEELPTDYQNEVTTVICRKIRPGHEKDYNDWVRPLFDIKKKSSWLSWHYNNHHRR